MKTIQAILCCDGSIFTDEAKAKAHEEDLLGQEIDGLLRLFCLDITRNQEFKGCLSAMSKRKELESAARKILAIIEHSRGEE